MKIETEESDQASTTTAINTPTDTLITEDLWDQTTTIIDAVPWAGSTFMIRDRMHGRIITVHGRTLRLEPKLSKLGGWHWDCVEKDGWLGFRSPVAGAYIGHNGKGKFIATAEQHRAHEFFCARRHPEGGYVLLMRHDHKLWKMDIGEDGKELVETEGAGALWEFVKV